MKEKLKNICTAILFFVLFLPVVSCNYNSQEKQPGEAPIEINFFSVLPADYHPVDDENSRSATPAFANDNLLYTVKAEKTSGTPSASIERNNVGTSFTLPLTAGTWVVTIDVYDKTAFNDSNNTNDVKLFTGSSEIEVSNVALALDAQPFLISLKVYESEGDLGNGNGNISLQIGWDTEDINISKIEYQLSNASLALDDSFTAKKIFTDFLFDSDNGKKVTLSYSAIPASRNYTLAVWFYDYNYSETEAVYLFLSDIAVFANCTTDTWRGEIELGVDSDGNPIAAGDKIKITQNLVNSRFSNYMYVKANTGSFTSAEQGTYENPYTSLQAAFNRINKIGDDTNPYVIYVIGSLSSDASTVDFTPTGNKTIDIRGISGASLSSDITDDYNISVEENNSFEVTLSLNDIDCGKGVNLHETKLSLHSVDAGKLNISDNCEINIGGVCDIEEIYLPKKTNGDQSQIKLKVTENIFGSHIGIKTQGLPSAIEPLVFTDGFNSNRTSPEENTILALASSIFTSIDGYEIGINNDGEAVFAISKGNISVNPTLPEIVFTISDISTEKKVTITAYNGDDAFELQKMDINITQSGIIQKSFTDNNVSSKEIDLSELFSGNYTIEVDGIYTIDGMLKTCGTSFQVTIE